MCVSGVLFRPEQAKKGPVSQAGSQGGDICKRWMNTCASTVSSCNRRYSYWTFIYACTDTRAECSFWAPARDYAMTMTHFVSFSISQSFLLPLHLALFPRQAIWIRATVLVELCILRISLPTASKRELALLFVGAQGTGQDHNFLLRCAGPIQVGPAPSSVCSTPPTPPPPYPPYPPYPR